MYIKLEKNNKKFCIQLFQNITNKKCVIKQVL